MGSNGRAYRKLREAGRIARLTALSLLTAASLSASAQSAKGFEAWRGRFAAHLIEGKEVDAASVHRLLDGIEYDASVAAILKRASDFKPTMRDYLSQRVAEERIAAGRDMMALHADLLKKIEDRYQVDRSAIVAIWCMETRFGAAELKYDALRSLATLAYAGARRSYFEDELAQLVVLISKGEIKSDHPKASIDGGLGQTQFMPDSFQRYAVDFDGDGVADIWGSTPDALASIANYLADFGWKRGGPYFVPAQVKGAFSKKDGREPHSLAEWAKLGAKPAEGEFDQALSARLYQPDDPKGGWMLVFDNFEALRRYNGGRRYAMAASLLAQGFGGQSIPEEPWPAPKDELAIKDISRLQSALARRGFDPGSTDGLYGEKTWRAMNAFLRKQGRKLELYPTRAVLALAETSGKSASKAD